MIQVLQKEVNNLRAELETKQEQINFLEGVVDIKAIELEAKQDAINSLSDIVNAKDRCLATKQGQVRSLEHVVSTKDRELDIVREQYLHAEAANKAAMLRVKQLKLDYQHCEEDIRLWKEYADTIKSPTDEIVGGGDQKNHIFEELGNKCERLRANNVELQEDSQRIGEKLKTAYEKHESNHKLLDIRKTEIEQLKANIKKLNDQ